MLNEFLIWWLQQLASLVPGALRRRADWAQDRRSIALAVLRLPLDNVPVVSLPARRGSSLPAGKGGAGSFPMDAAGVAALRSAAGNKPAPVVVRLPDGMLLERSITLPLAAERDAGRVLGYEMDRLTPFAAAELFWTWAIERRDPAAGRIDVRLSFFPRARLERLLHGLADAGLRLAGLEASGPDGQTRRLAVAAAPRGWWPRHGLALGAVACAALAVTAVALPFVAQAQEADRIEARIAVLRPDVDRAEALRRSIVDRAGTADVMQAARGRVGDPLAMLAALTAVLPDDTYLIELTWRSRAVTVVGESAAAARLIPALAAEPGFRNPTFTAPVTRLGLAEGFAIRAETVP